MASTMKILSISFIFIYFIITNLVYANNPIQVKTVYPPKCTLLKEKNGLLCPRIIEVEVEIISNINKHLVRCTLFSEEEEILAFGESFLDNLLPLLMTLYLVQKLFLIAALLIYLNQ